MLQYLKQSAVAIIRYISASYTYMFAPIETKPDMCGPT